MSQKTFVSSELVDDTQIVKLTGEFDLRTTPRFEQVVADALDDGADEVLVDLRSVSFLDATMLRALVRAREQVAEHGRGFALIRPHPLVWRIFVLTGLHRALPTRAGVPAAVGSRHEPGLVTTAADW